MTVEVQLTETCGACPEQYDATINGEVVGFLRLRHGHFYVQYPGVGGRTVYDAHPNGDGCFETDERDFHLTLAKRAIMVAWMNDQDGEQTFVMTREVWNRHKMMVRSLLNAADPDHLLRFQETVAEFIDLEAQQ